jgi:hypothetical protein
MALVAFVRHGSQLDIEDDSEQSITTENVREELAVSPRLQRRRRPSGVTIVNATTVELMGGRRACQP